MSGESTHDQKSARPLGSWWLGRLARKKDNLSSAAAAGAPPTAFVLDEGADFEHAQLMSMESRWVEFPHAPERERGLVMLAGETVRTPCLRLPYEPILWLRCLRGLERISDDGLDAELSYSEDGDSWERLISLPLVNNQPDAGVREIQTSLPLRQGTCVRIELRCTGGPENLVDSDWLAVSGLVICDRSEFPLMRARSQLEWRKANELQHFSQVYTGEFYRSRRSRRTAATSAHVARDLPSLGACPSDTDAVRAALRERLKPMVPTRDENPFSYTHRMLSEVVRLDMPHFPGRMTALSGQAAGGPLRMLSLCAGEAAIEAQIIRQAGVPVELCVLDINSKLLEEISKNMPDHVTIDPVLGNVNDISPALGQFDIINITSGLHHVVELEKVLSAIATMLAPKGEFWLIGEQVGRNGNRLWREARVRANEIFSTWPEKWRLNQNTGKVDQTLPDADFSRGCFEGIRSEDILEAISKFFLPMECCVRDAFLWRLVDVAYAANFDMSNALDLDVLRDLVVEEAVLWARGGLGVELNGSYRSKLAALAAP